MTIHAYTSFSFSYLNRARVLARTLKKLHPDWMLWAVITDHEPQGFVFNLEREDFDGVLKHEDLIDKNNDQWLFGHDVIEACTAVKGAAALHLLNHPSCEQLFYFDPDIALINGMEEVVELLSKYSIVLTPHQIDPEARGNHQSIRDNEIASLNYGVFNLGFIAMANDSEAHRFAHWWDDRLQDWCHDRLDIGVFVDQKWCNLVPCFFDNVKVLRDPGYNVASWNLNQRNMSFNDAGQALINGMPLRFYHFTKLDSVGDLMTQRYALDNIEIYELWWWYRHQVLSFSSVEIPNNWWYYSMFDNGEKIPKAARELYRSRTDLRSNFPKPFQTDDLSFYKWLISNTDIISTSQ